MIMNLQVPQKQELMSPFQEIPFAMELIADIYSSCERRSKEFHINLLA
jgi:hypothetical protein